ncbi:MAG: AI-2E family transporter [Ornithinimicrobium sp.]
MSTASSDPNAPGPTGSLLAGLPRSAVLLISVGGAALGAAALQSAASIIAPMMLAFVLTIAVLPISAATRRHRWPGWLATLTTLVSAYAILAVLVFGAALCMVKLAGILPSYASKATDLTDQVQKWLKSIGVANSSTEKVLQQIDPTKVSDFLESTLAGVLGAFSNLFVLVTLMFFFVAAVSGFGPRMGALSSTKPELAASMARFVNGTGSYLVVTALFGAIVAVLDTGALWLLGVPLPLVWGFFSFLTNFIPNIGFVIGVIPPALLALLDSGWQSMVLVIVIYSILNVTIQTFIQPRYVGASVGLSAEVTFLSLVVWTFLLGALGALLAVPMTLLVRAIFIDADSRASWITPLITTSVDPEEEPDPESGPTAGQTALTSS